MNLSQKLFVARKLAIVTLFSMFVQLVTPVAAFALTSGPSAPEFSSFEPVATNNMVDLFSGDFTYNIPVLDIPGAHGGGYAMSLSYHSGASLEEEASWVGYGWTLNPGAINHGKQGFSDDWNGVPVRYYNKTKPNKTVSAHASLSPEAFSIDGIIAGTVGYGISYNNYKGFRWSADLGISMGGGIVSLGYSLNNSGQHPFSLGINPGALFSKNLKKLKKSLHETEKEVEITEDDCKREELNKKITGLKKEIGPPAARQKIASNYGMNVINHETAFSSNPGRYSGVNFTMEASVLPNPGLPVGMSPTARINYTQQTPDAMYNCNAKGFMYTADADEEDLTDYRVENNNPYNNRSPFIGVPINNADSYAMTGEGALGGFRVYNRSGVGFGPIKTANSTSIFNPSINFEVGGDVGAGSDIKIGIHTLSINKWDMDNVNDDKNNAWNASVATTDIREDKFFRFDSDMADGVFSGGYDTNLESANVLQGNSSIVPDLSNKVGITANPFGPDENTRIRRSSFIDYNTFEAATSNPYKYSNDPVVNGYLPNPPLDDVKVKQVREFSTVNKDGMMYVYGLPVFSKNEASITYNASAVSTGYTSDNSPNPYKIEGDVIDGFNADNIANDATDVITDTDNNVVTKVGQVVAAPYASTYLLTAITTPDYQDRTGDGPTDDDFGGYTRFVYDRAYGDNDWYNWRMPYNGFLYQKNTISNAEDDAASANWGEKEVYYLRYIETKTHVAVFDLSARLDGKGACVATAADEECSGTQPLYKLDKVTLFAKKNTLDWSHSNKLKELLDNNTIAPVSLFSQQILDAEVGNRKMFEPIKSVNFAYNYSLCTGVPNSTAPAESGIAAKGKLTLTKIWTEYRNIPSYKISPYEFAYAYPTSNSFTSINNNYTFGNYGSGLVQNPAYTPVNVDSWQNYQANGGDRYNKMQTWVNQNPASNFDPAAWQLKQITLPSGGQILVQYEQDDYSYVQDTLAHAMVSCSNMNVNNNNDDMEVILNLSELGVSSSSYISTEYLLNLIKKEYLTPQTVQVTTEETALGGGTSTDEENRRIYFKFLYKLLGNSCSLNCRLNEYIDGYAHLLNAEISGNNIKLTFDGNPMAGLCNDFFQAEANQKLTNTVPANCSDNTDILADINSIPDAAQALVDVIANAANAMSEHCLDPCPENSYVRIPIPNKKGGGLRVKRLLTYDPNVGATGSESVFGSEYIYKTTRTDTDANGTVTKLISSGVATNEPSGAREENILVDFIPRFKQNWFKKLVGGEDKDVLEGPLGESLLPPPSVGYSQVIVRNIHGGVTNPGFSVNTYYTAKDFPFKSEMSDLDIESTYVPIYAGLFNMVQDARWLAQGFRFLINEMHGQIHTVTSYSGSYYTPSISGTEQEILKNKLVGNLLGEVVTSTEYEYFEPGSKLPTITAQSATDPRAIDYFSSSSTWDGQLHQAISMMPLGQEIDVTTESKKIVDEFENVGVEYDASLVLLGLIPIPLPTICPEATFNKSRLHTHATTKVVRYPTVLKKIKTTANGLSSVTENYLFNRETGEPIVTLTYVPNTIVPPLLPPNNPINPSLVPFTDRGYVNYNFPASMQYANMSQKAKNARAIFKNVQVISAGTAKKIKITGFDGKYQNYFSKGDIICAKQGTYTRYSTVSSIATDGIIIVKNHPSLLPVNNANFTTDIEIVRSGNTNQLSTMAGNFTAYKIGNLDGTGDHTTPPAAISTEWSSTLPSYLQIPQNGLVSSYDVFNVVSASAAVFSDNATIGNNTYTPAANIANSWYYNEPYEHYYPYAAANNPCSYGTSYNLYQLNKRGKWRLHSTFAYEAKNGTSGSLLSLSESYKNQTSGINATQYSTYAIPYTDQYTPDNSTDKNYEAGTYTLGIFNWRNTNGNIFNTNTGRWLRTNLITKYSPHGDPLEESNILGIKSCAKYGYNKTLPYLTAQNAEYNSVYFESFENAYNYPGDNCATGTNCVEDECSINNRTSDAHSGYYGYTIHGNSEYNIRVADIANYPLSTDAERQFSVKFWAKGTTCSNNNVEEINNTICGLRVYYPDYTPTPPTPEDDGKITYLATSGDWHLFEKIVNNNNNGLRVQIKTYQPIFPLSCSCTLFVIDDVRIQPIDAQMNCYVYDNKTQQLLTTFDDQHFGTYYQYNEKGQLVRKIIETERGKKTVQENQYNTPKKINQ